MDASTNLEAPLETALPEKIEEETRRFQFDWNAIRNSPAFVPGVAIAIGLFALFWGLFKNLPSIWFGEDGYYSHGILVPLISGYVIYRWWPSLKNIPVKPSFIAVLPLLAILWMARFSVAFMVDSVSSGLLILALLSAIAFIGGWRWMLAVALPTVYLGFALPMWNMAISYYTNPLQTRSTDIAEKMLGLVGYQMHRDQNLILLFSGANRFDLDVGVPCSGFKLVLALYAFTIFFALIARLRWWANVVLVLLVPLPLALFINGLRIALIGVVGVEFGSEWGHKFHDYSGYISLIICFFMLFKIARWLGWKD
jgi:exosortase